MKSQALLRREAIAGLVLAASIGALTLVLSAGASGQAVDDPADLRVAKSDSPDPAFRGGVLRYTIQVTNLGPDPALATVVEDKLPGGLNFLSVATTTGACTQQARTVTCNLSDLAADASATITIRTRVTKRRGAINNTATVESTTDDPVAANNQDTERTTIRLRPRGPTCRGLPATIVGTPGDNVLFGTTGRDVIVALGGDDRIFAGGGRDVVCAGPGFDLVRGGPKGDFISGGLNADRLLGGRGLDTMRGNAGLDRLRGGPGADTMRGNAGPDRLRGGPGADTLRGNRGRDRLWGGFGADLLAGGLGIDRCRGGPGRDTLRSCER
jgi:uncharacterized repeat protein (TIGR01451 family)